MLNQHVILDLCVISHADTVKEITASHTHAFVFSHPYEYYAYLF